jgi:Calpain family cysteine protease
MTTPVDASTFSRRTGCEGDPSDTSGARPTTDERADRAAANDRYNAFVEGSPCNYTCEAADRVFHPVLFRTEGGDLHEVDEKDIGQNKLDDCHLMATLAGLAQTPEGRAVIKNAVSENKNEKGEVVSYTVMLHKPEEHYWGLGATTFTQVPVTVGTQFVCGHAKARTEGDVSEVWSPVIESAFLQYKDRDYGMCSGDAERGGAPSTAMQLLTGREAKQVGWNGYSALKLQRDVAAGKLVVFDTKDQFVGCNPYEFKYWHAYAVTGTENRDGKLFVNLLNPIDDKVTQAPYDELHKWFSAVDVGSVR